MLLRNHFIIQMFTFIVDHFFPPTIYFSTLFLRFDFVLNLTVFYLSLDCVCSRALANYSCGKCIGDDLGSKPLAVHCFCMFAWILFEFLQLN